MKSILIYVGMAMLIGAAFFAGKEVGNSQAVEGNARAIEFKEEQIHKLNTENALLSSENSVYRTELNKMNEEYNNLYKAANAYVNAPRYTPMYCSGTQYGVNNNYSSFTCY